MKMTLLIITQNLVIETAWIAMAQRIPWKFITLWKIVIKDASSL